jgi:hypothetical protein
LLWHLDGTWDRLLAQVQTQANAVGEVSVDSTSVRVHQHAAGARHQLSRADDKFENDAVYSQRFSLPKTQSDANVTAERNFIFSELRRLMMLAQ